jgi:hypothetical protein
MEWDVTRAYGLGWNAHHAIEPQNANPFDMDDDLVSWLDWDRGWQEAQLSDEKELYGRD